MAYPLNDDHEMIRDTARGWLADWRDSRGLEQAVDNGGYDLEKWREISAQLGWTGIAIAEEFGGAGLGLLGRAVLMEELGGALYCGPYFSTCCMAAEYVDALGSAEHRKRMLGEIASGKLILAFADARSTVTFKDNRLDGTVPQIVDGAGADELLITVSNNDADVVLIALTTEFVGVEVVALETMDCTRNVARLNLSNVAITDDNIVGLGSAAKCNLARYRTYTSLAAECVGGAQRCLDMTVEYAKQRIQFDRPIASFQAIKHRCADMMIAVEEARSATYLAATADTNSIDELALIAKSVATENYFSVAGDAIQLHGGIGFTWEYPLHFYFKRARANRAQYGSAGDAYDELARCIGVGASAGGGL